MRIGIVGAENSHTAAIAKLCNIQRACGRARVVAVWGETRAFAEKAAAAGEIPNIVKRPEEMIGEIDGVVIDHRHPKHHMPVARLFIEAQVPTFVDKPFSYGLRKGCEVIELARKKDVPITGYSVLPEQEAFRKNLLKQIREAGAIKSIFSTGPCDIRSRYGGIFFYGIHQVGLILEAFGPGIRKVEVIRAPRGNPNAVAVMHYGDGGPIVTMECLATGQRQFAVWATGEKGMVHYVHEMDPNPYLAGTKKFIRMFRTGKEPYTAQEILEPVAVLEALDKSIRTRKPARVAKIPCA
jgi:predicted dehydrogenase